MYTGWERRNLSLTKLYLSSWPYYFPLPKKKKHNMIHSEDTQNCQFLFQTLKHINLHITHHSLFSALKWTSLVGSRQPSSSAWQCCGKGLPGMSTSFPSFFAGPCMPAHSHGTAGRNTRPEARSYSSMCSQTAKGQQGWFESWSGDMVWGRMGGEMEEASPLHEPAWFSLYQNPSCSLCQKMSKPL